jgi:hypothetical protein
MMHLEKKCEKRKIKRVKIPNENEETNKIKEKWKVKGKPCPNEEGPNVE